MNIRVIGGIYGGRVLDTPTGRTTHPMGERIRNAVFNSLGASVQGAKVLDAFAGTGAVGIEALSRGAESAVFIEKDKIAQKCIQNNITALGIARAQLVKATVHGWLQTYTGEPFDAVFADPPYYDTQQSTVMRLAQVVAPGGILVVSWPQADQAPDIPSMQPFFERTYAGARLVMYKK